MSPLWNQRTGEELRLMGAGCILIRRYTPFLGPGTHFACKLTFSPKLWSLPAGPGPHLSGRTLGILQTGICVESPSQ